MIPSGLFSQISMIVLAVGIGIFLIKPTFDDIQTMQDEITKFQEQRQTIDEVNAQLASLVARLESVSADDQRRLLTYIPDQIDTLAVPRKLQSMAQQTGLIFQTVSYEEVNNELVTQAEKENNTAFPVPHEFSLTVEGSYSQIKDFLSLLEQNDSPLEVRQLTISSVDGNFLTSNITLTTYSHEYPEQSPFTNF
jgi:hypothetical protein